MHFLQECYNNSMTDRNIATKVAISGGGPAGIMLGYLLARSGIDVTVLEKWPDFFRDFRGDTIHPSTMENLYELGILERFLALHHSKTRQVEASISGETLVVADFSYLHLREPYIAFIPQWDFLNFISGEAKRFPSFHLRMATEATDLIIEDEKVVGIKAKDADGAFDIRADLVVAADGRHSTIRPLSGLISEDLGAPIDVLWFSITRTESDGDKSLGMIDRGLMMPMINRTEYWQCGFVIAKGEFEHIKQRGIEAFQKNILHLAPFLGERVREISDWDKVKMLSVSVEHLLKWQRDGFLAIGDAAHTMSPVGGVGINFAIQDAVASANILVPAFARGGVTLSDLKAVQKRREFPARLTQRFQVFIQNRIMKNILTDTGDRTPLHIGFPLNLIRLFPFLSAIPARMLGVGVRPEHVETKEVAPATTARTT